MAGLTPKLPLLINDEDGHYALIKSYKDLVRQNFKNLVLTNPGERVMDVDFGVGIQGFLFELDNGAVRSSLQSRIQSQAAKYMPFVEITNIGFNSQATNPNASDNLLSLRIEYIIIPLQEFDNIDINTPNY